LKINSSSKCRLDARDSKTALAYLEGGFMKYTVLAVLGAVSLAACAPMTAKPATPATTAPATPTVTAPATPAATTPTPATTDQASNVLTWATFENAAADMTAQAGKIETNAYSEKPGDSSRETQARENTNAILNYMLTKAGGSSFLGAGMTINAPKNGTFDLSTYKSMRIKLSSSASTTVRLRISGTDVATQNNGCYPVRYTKVSDKLEVYTVAISEFGPESYCAANARSLAQTLPVAAVVEIADNEVPSSPRKGKISISSIEFLK
jgi:hypothetical protein